MDQNTFYKKIALNNFYKRNFINNFKLSKKEKKSIKFKSSIYQRFY